MNDTIQVTIEKGTSKTFPIGVTPLEILHQENGNITGTIVAARVNGNLIDLHRSLNEDSTLEFVSFDSKNGKEVFWHSSAHLMAHAIKRLYPQAMLAFGPPVDNGFYYDIDLNVSLTPEDLGRIEDEMHKLVNENLSIRREEISKEEASALFKGIQENYKVESLAKMDGVISIYRQGEFVDLCRGPHLPSTDYIKYFKLLSLAGAYWLGDERNQMLQRIYGISFPVKEDLDLHLKMIEEAERRDHRKLGKELNLFSFHLEGPGFVFWKPAGMIVYNEVIEYLREVHRRDGYFEIKTPIILHKKLWKQSGHWDHYKNNMYFTKIDGEQYSVKPMNCPGGLLVFKERMWSYKDLPVKFAELGLVHRHEKSGVLHGLFRVRQFTQDDAHVFCLPEQIEEEVIKVINLLREIYSSFGFTEYKVELSTRPDKSIGSARDWEHAEQKLKNALERTTLQYEINEGEGAFYGPKIDFHIKDCLFRTWQCGTIQVDFSMPRRFELEYTTSKGTKARPVMIHRAILGSLERFIGVLIEHYGGDLPLWLSPTQVMVLPIAERHHEYGREVRKQLESKKIRCEVDERSEKIGYKIRDGEMRKIPYMLIIGDREQEAQSVSIRTRKKGDLGVQPVSELLQSIIQERDNRQ